MALVIQYTLLDVLDHSALLPPDPAPIAAEAASPHLKSSMLSSSALAGPAPLPSAEGGAVSGSGLPAASLASVGSCADETCATCRRMRKRSYSASNSSLSGSSLEAPTWSGWGRGVDQRIWQSTQARRELVT